MKWVEQRYIWTYSLTAVSFQSRLREYFSEAKGKPDSRLNLKKRKKKGLKGIRTEHHWDPCHTQFEYIVFLPSLLDQGRRNIQRLFKISITNSAAP